MKSTSLGDVKLATKSAGHRRGASRTKQDKIAKRKQLYVMTVGALSGKAIAMTRHVRDRNGWELWRQVAVDYEPTRASRVLGHLAELLKPRLSWPEASYEDRLMTWEGQIADYEAQQGRKLDHGAKRASIMAQAPQAPKQNMVTIYAVSLPTYQSMREQVLNYSISRQIWIPAKGRGKRNQGKCRAWARRALARKPRMPTTVRAARTRRTARLQAIIHGMKVRLHGQKERLRGVLGTRMKRARGKTEKDKSHVKC